jgi:predicted nucleic acid-binding protein
MTSLSRLLLLFDTNVLVYAATPNGGPKALRAAQVVFDAIRAGVAVVSSQNMLEFFRATTRERPAGRILHPDRALAYVESVAGLV